MLNVYGWKTEEEARKHVKVYTDRYEEMLDDDSIDAVIIALPLHLHDVVAIKAMRKGKHVLTEKLMGHSVAQCKEMARVAEATDMLLTTGHQRHYNVLYENAVDTLRRGILGDVHYIRRSGTEGIFREKIAGNLRSLANCFPKKNIKMPFEQAGKLAPPKNSTFGILTNY